MNAIQNYGAGRAFRRVGMTRTRPVVSESGTALQIPSAVSESGTVLQIPSAVSESGTVPKK